MKPILIISFFLSINALADCAKVLGKVETSRVFYNLALKKKEARYYSKAELVTLFTVRDRIKNFGIAIIETKEEAAIFSEIAGTNIQIGSSLNMANFESLLTKAYYNYVLDYSNKPQFRYMDNDDVLQAAQIGFLNAVRSYDYNKGMLSTFAHYHILKEMNQLMLDQDIVSRFSNPELMSQAGKLNKVLSKLKTDLGKTPSHSQLAEAYNKTFSESKPLTVAQVGHLMDRVQTQQGSMYHPDGTEMEFASYFGDPEALLRDKQEIKRIQELFRRANLSRKQIRLLVLNLGLPIHVYDNEGQLINVPEGGMTLREISAIDGTTHQALHRQMQNALEALRKAVVH